jgi:hypothetical protein
MNYLKRIKMKRIIIIASTTILLIAIALSMYLLNGCQKNVDPIKLKTQIDVSSYVRNSETFEGINAVEITVDGEVVATTNTDGKFTISTLDPGDYLITATKNGYSKGSYNLKVEESGAKLPEFVLKELSEPVIIGVSGGSAEALRASGEQAAVLVIPAGELSSEKQVSATSLVGNEVPKILSANNKLLGTTITLNSNDENISFQNGAQLTFKLPFMHKPGDFVEVTHFNDAINEWESFDNAVVGQDGISASVTIYHFSTYSANINGNYSEKPDENIGYEIIGNSDDYDSVYKWSSSLEYRNGIPDGIDKEWLYKTVENQTKLNFSTVTYNNTLKSATDVITPAMISSTILPPPVGNPVQYSNLPERPWELVIKCCWIHEMVEVDRWNKEYNGYIVDSVPNWYQVCALFWVWIVEPNPTEICYPSDCYPYAYYWSPTIVRCEHQGGSGN